MPTKTTSKPNANGSAPSPEFRLPPIHEWVECDDPDINEAFVNKPLKVRVQVNPSRAEVMALAQAVQEVLDRDGDDSELFELVAPRITEWNIVAETREGETIDLPTPSERGGQVIEVLPPRAQMWLVRLARTAHLGGDARSKLSRRPAATEVTEGERTPSGPQIVDIPTTATHHVPPKSS